MFEADRVQPFATSEALAYVVDLEVLPDGRVWLLNSAAPYFVGFEADASPIAPHGTDGEGAREFRRPLGLVEGGVGGEAWVVDEARAAMIRISRPDEWVERGWDPDSIPPGTLMGADDRSYTWLRTVRLGDVVVLPRTRMQGEGSFPSVWRSMWGADLVAVDSTGAARTIVSLGEVLGDPGVDTDFEMEIPPMPMWVRLWTVCGSELVVVDRPGNAVRRFDPEGREGGPTPLPSPAWTTVSNDQFARSMLEVAAMEAAGAITLEPPAIDTATMLPTIPPRIRGDGARLASVLPRYTAVHCADDDALWLRRFDPDFGGLRGGRDWLRIDGDGSMTDVRFPERFHPFEFEGGRIWGIHLDALDVPSVAWIAW